MNSRVHCLALFAYLRMHAFGCGSFMKITFLLRKRSQESLLKYVLNDVCTWSHSFVSKYGDLERMGSVGRARRRFVTKFETHRGHRAVTFSRLLSTGSTQEDSNMTGNR